MNEKALSRELLILRHGKSDWSVDCNDFDRPLKNRGKRAAEKMGDWLLQQNLIPDLVLSSPAERAVATAENVCLAMGLDMQMTRVEKNLYDSHPDKIRKILSACPGALHRVLLVAHNPDLEYLLEYLAGSDLEIPDDGKLLPTATLARLLMPHDWGNLAFGCARLQEIIRPSTLF